jgi:hypothetical protein
MLHEASSKAGNRATAAWRRRFGSKPNADLAAPPPPPVAHPKIVVDDQSADKENNVNGNAKRDTSRLGMLGWTAATGAAMAAGSYAFAGVASVKQLPSRVLELPGKAMSYTQTVFA